MRLKTRRIGAGLLAVLLFGAACGGGQPTGAGQPSAQATLATAAPAGSAAASSAAAGPNLLDLLKTGKQTNYKVSYRWSIVTGGQTITSQQTWYYKPPKARFDYALGQTGTSFSLFVLETGTFLCTSAGGTAFCQKSSQQSALQQNQAADFDLQVRDHPDQFNSTYQGTRAIAGQQGQCYVVKSLAASALGEVTSCYSSAGVPLYQQIKAQGSEVTMEATSFSTTVSDADFQLPAPPL